MSQPVTDEQVVRQTYPDAIATWTSRGWRILMDVPNIGVEEVGRTNSGHVPESEAWADARKRIESLPPQAALRQKRGAAK